MPTKAGPAFKVWMLRSLPRAPALLGCPRTPALPDSLFTALHELDQVGEQHVPVALAEAVHIVGHLMGQEGTSAAVGGAVGHRVWGLGCPAYLASVVVDDKA